MAAWEFQTLQNIADRNGWHKFISMQNYYNLIYREEEREMVSLSLSTYNILTSPLRSPTATTQA
jgi:aryl-alcohol dehydrogenase-like predicted oxidoreductase